MKNSLKHLLFLIQAALLALLFYGFSRLIFIYFTFDQFPLLFEDGIGGALVQGVRFDLSTFAYLNIILILLSLLLQLFQSLLLLGKTRFYSPMYLLEIMLRLVTIV